MMKVTVCLLFALEVCAAFSPLSSWTRETTRLQINRGEIDYLNALDKDVGHAHRVVYMECDEEGCAIAESVHVGDEWTVEGGLDGEHPHAHVEKVLMIMPDVDE